MTHADIGPAAHSVVQRVIDASAASEAVHAAVAHAAKLGICINVAVVDAGGNLAAFLRMPGAFLHSIDIAIDKAYTAASFGCRLASGTRRCSSIPKRYAKASCVGHGLSVLVVAYPSTRQGSALAASVYRVAPRNRTKPVRKPGWPLLV